MLKRIVSLVLVVCLLSSSCAFAAENSAKPAGESRLEDASRRMNAAVDDFSSWAYGAIDSFSSLAREAADGAAGWAHGAIDDVLSWAGDIADLASEALNDAIEWGRQAWKDSLAWTSREWQAFTAWAEENAARILQFLKERLLFIAEKFFDVTEAELQAVLENLQALLSEDTLKDLFASENPVEYARQLLKKALEPVTGAHDGAALPAGEEYDAALEDTLGLIYHAYETETAPAAQ